MTAAYTPPAEINVKVLSGFPADASFESDRRARVGHIKVWRYAKNWLDFTEVREGMRWHIARITGVDEPDVKAALDDLVAWGYLLEHPRGYANVRRFTLLWSVRADLRPDFVATATLSAR